MPGPRLRASMHASDYIHARDVILGSVPLGGSLPGLSAWSDPPFLARIPPPD
jgi:hypothetical protein